MPATSLDASTWPQIAAGLELSGLSRQLAANCAVLARQGAVVRLGLDARHESMRTKAQEERLAQALSRTLGEAVRIEIEVVEAPTGTLAADRARQSASEMDAARAALEGDPMARSLQERFSATLHPETVRPTGK